MADNSDSSDFPDAIPNPVLEDPSLIMPSGGTGRIRLETHEPSEAPSAPAVSATPIATPSTDKGSGEISLSLDLGPSPAPPGFLDTDEEKTDPGIVVPQQQQQQ